HYQVEIYPAHEVASKQQAWSAHRTPTARLPTAEIRDICAKIPSPVPFAELDQKLDRMPAVSRVVNRLCL
ncbi:hypothetical protein, partial [Thalassospira lucentensis]|uniref:hypothetical protein n=1 Tax=Thalassospira lucentensis TaxID=168935 RepID=UPI0023F06A78